MSRGSQFRIASSFGAPLGNTAFGSREFMVKAELPLPNADYADSADRTGRITGEHLGLDNFFLDVNDLGKPLASRGRLPRNKEAVRAETPAVDAAGSSPRNPRNPRQAVAASSSWQAKDSVALGMTCYPDL